MVKVAPPLRAASLGRSPTRLLTDCLTQRAAEELGRLVVLRSQQAVLSPSADGRLLDKKAVTILPWCGLQIPKVTIEWVYNS